MEYDKGIELYPMGTPALVCLLLRRSKGKCLDSSDRRLWKFDQRERKIKE